jgi:putative transposase
MKGKHRSPEEIVKILEDVSGRMKSGERMEEICRTLEISVGTFWRWRARYGGMQGQEMKKLKELETENGRLKRIITELELDKAILREVLEGKH